MTDAVLRRLEARLEARAATQDGVLTRADVLAAGGSPSLVRRQLRDATWSPLLRGSYLTDPFTDGVALQRAWARSGVLTVTGGVIGLGTAARLLGIEGVPRSGLVDVLVPWSVPAGGRALRTHQFVLAPEEVVDLRGIRCTSVVRTLADLVPRLERPDALAVLDSALRSRLVDPSGLALATAGAAGRRECRAVADLWELADARAESPLESRARLRCVDAGLPPDELQLLVRDEHGHVVARADAAFHRRTRARALPLLLEADGVGPHGTPEALHRDRWRANALVALGYDVVRCTWRDTLDPAVIPTMVRRAL